MIFNTAKSGDSGGETATVTVTGGGRVCLVEADGTVVKPSLSEAGAGTYVIQCPGIVITAGQVVEYSGGMTLINYLGSSSDFGRFTAYEVTGDCTVRVESPTSSGS